MDYLMTCFMSLKACLLVIINFFGGRSARKIVDAARNITVLSSNKRYIITKCAFLDFVVKMISLVNISKNVKCR